MKIELRLRGAARFAGPLFALWYGPHWERGLGTLKSMMEARTL